jgi:hypothetical protein
MAQSGALKILVICPWVIKLTGMQASLRAVELAATIVRVDFEAALRAAVLHHRFAAAFYANTPGFPLASADAMIRQYAPKLALTTVDRLEEIGPLLAKHLADARS